LKEGENENSICSRQRSTKFTKNANSALFVFALVVDFSIVFCDINWYRFLLGTVSGTADNRITGSPST
jgi:hypothetical protein